MEFLAFDVETANYDYASICQVGVAHFKDGNLIDTYDTLVNPEDYFDPFMIGIHGIKAEDVRQAPKFPDIYPKLFMKFKSLPIVHHMPFDKVALKQACDKHDLELPDFTWIDSARVARRTWEEVSHKGYGLKDLANKFDIKFQHHSALEDAKAAGFIFLEATKHSGMNVGDWISELKKHSSRLYRQKNDFSSLEPNIEGDLYGEYICFTGALEIPRIEAANLAAFAGCTLQKGVNKKTSILVVGQRDISKYSGQVKSTKYLRAEELIVGGQPIRVIGEDDFFIMLNQHDPGEKEVLEITAKYIHKNDKKFIKDSPINVFARKNVFVSNGMKYKESLIFQMIGNFGGTANNFEFNSTTDIYVVSHEHHSNLQKGIKNDEIKNLEAKINKKKGIYDKLIIISEDAVIEYVKQRVAITNDHVTGKLVERVDAE